MYRKGASRHDEISAKIFQMQCIRTRLVGNRNRRNSLTEVQETRVRKYLKRKLLERCRERAKVSRQQTLYEKRTRQQEITPSQLLKADTPLQDAISEKNFLDSLTEKEYEEWMVALERTLQEDLTAEEQDLEQQAVEYKALEELEFERQLIESYEWVLER